MGVWDDPDGAQGQQLADSRPCNGRWEQPNTRGSSQPALEQQPLAQSLQPANRFRMGPVGQREDSHPWRRRHLLRYREPRRTAIQHFMLPAAA